MKFRSILVHRLTFLSTAIIYVALLAPSAHAQFQWSQRIASTTSWPEGEPNIGLALDTNDNCYVTGFFDGTNNFGGVTLTNQSGGGSDIFVAKYNSTGALQWAQRAGGTSINYGRGIGVDTNGNVYATGGYSGSAKFGGINLPAPSGEEFFLAKYNNAGALKWVQSSTGGSDDVYGIGLTVDGAGNSYALVVVDHLGGAGGSVTFGATTVTIPANGGTTLTVLVKYDNTGTAKWAQLFDSSQETYATKFAVDAAGNVYVRGLFEVNMTIGTSNLVVSPANETENMFIAKFNNSGALIWVQQPTGGNAGEGGVAVDLAGNVFVSGYFDTNLIFGGGITLTNMANTNALFGDAFLAKYNSAGAIQWAQSAGGTNGGFYWDLSLDTQTNIYAGGFVGYNAAVAKYNPAGTLQWAVSASGTPTSPVASGFGNCVVDSIGNCYLAGFYQGTASFGAITLQSQETWNFFLTEVASYTFGPQTQSTPSASITYDSGTGLFQYTDTANSTDDSAKIPLTGTAATLITTSNNWTTSLTANISARSMSASVSESPHVWMQLAVYYTNGSSTYLLTFSLQQENNTGGANNENFPNGFYGTGVTLRGRTNGNDDVTMPLGASQLIQGGSVLLLSGGTTASPATESISAVTGVLTLNYNASLNTVTGYYNGAPIGSYSLASWGANLPLTLFVAGSSGEGIGASTGTATASNFYAGPLSVNTPLQVTTTSLPNGTNGMVYNQTLAASGGQTPYTWTNISGALPSGLTLAASGLIFGTPTTNGTFNFTVKVTDALSVTATQALALTLLGPPSVTLQPTNNPVTVLFKSNVTFSASVTGTGPFSYQWQLNGTNLPNGIITTVAGNGNYGYSGDESAATNAELDSIRAGFVIDTNGNLFIADSYNQRIRKVGTNGIVTTVAGNGNYGYFGDSGAATNAKLNFPFGVTVDATGNLFIADTDNNRIRKVGANGIITTLAGNGTNGYSGDGGTATNAELYEPNGVTVDATGNLFIADTINFRIREVSTNGIITTVAGNGQFGYSGDGIAATNAEFAYPMGVAVDATGNLFIADLQNNRIRKVGTNQIITMVAGNGTAGYSGDDGAATNAELNYPNAVFVDAFGNLFIADYNNNVIREVGTNGIITTIAGNGTEGYSGDGGQATSSGLGYSWGVAGVAMDATGNLFLDDSGSRIRKVFNPGFPGTFVLKTVGIGNAGAYDVVVSSPYGSITSSVVNLIITGPLQVTTSTLSSGTNAFAYSQQLSAIFGQLPYSWSLISGSLPPGLTLAANGMISGTSTNSGTYNFTVKVTDANNSTATQSLTLTLFGPPSVTLQPTNNAVAVIVGHDINFTVSATGTGSFSYQWQLNGTNLPNGIITTLAGNGTAGYSGDGGTAASAELSYPIGVAVDATGDLFIADKNNYCIRKVGTNGIITTVAGNGTAGYSGDGGQATNAEMRNPYGVAVDSIGNLFIADWANNCIRKVGTNGIITTFAGNGYGAGLGYGNYTGDGGAATNAELYYPYGVAVDAKGNLFIADWANNRVRKVGTNGIITTFAGSYASGYFGGDGGAATNAALNAPMSVAVDATGDLFFGDEYNYRVRKVGTNGIITTVAGNGTPGYSGDGGTATNEELSYATGEAADFTGNLFIVDDANHRIRKVGTNGIITTVAGNGINGFFGDGGAATSAELSYPWGVTLSATGNMLISDGNNRIRQVTNTQGPILSLNNVGYSNAGVYDVVVSGPYGSVTSSVVNVTITIPPVILSVPQFSVGNTNFTFLLSGPSGSNYVLQVSTNLLNWSPVRTSTIPVSGTLTLSNDINGYNNRFYRAYLQ